MRFRGLGPEIYTLPVVNQLPQVKPMPLVERSEPFNHPEWIYEIKYDGFRALAYIDSSRCQLVSRRGTGTREQIDSYAYVTTQVMADRIYRMNRICARRFPVTYSYSNS